MNLNYELFLREYIKDIDSNASLFKHKSGAEIIFIENEDIDRVFSITFNTAPKDNTGVFHVLEHCVLCGSKQFSVKDPFNELDKGTLNTYLNAITFSDKTMYPIASTNKKDFYNLMQVYLDAVFFPLIYEKKGIFLQEGIRETPNGLNGVVYNEMKGAFSDPQTILEFKSYEALFKDTDYKFCAAGVPENIEELTYEYFLETYEKYYHPANSIIYIYGKLEVQECLEFLDKEYLSKFDNNGMKTCYKIQTAYDEALILEESYIVKEKIDDKNILQASFVTGVSTDFITTTALDIISDALVNSESGIIKKRLIEEGICQSVEAYIDTDMFQPVFVIRATNSSEKNVHRFKKIIEDCFAEIVNIGFDEKLIIGLIKSEKFYLLEKDFGYKPKGLYYNILLMQTFLYGRKDFEILKFKDIFNELSKIDFKEIVLTYLLKNDCSSYSILKPEKGKDKKLNAVKTKKEDLDFLDYQNTIDRQEDIQKIPCINISDISRDIFKINSQLKEESGCKILFNEINEKDISYVSLLIDVSKIPLELKKYLNIFSYLLGYMDTKNYSFEELDSEVHYYFGDFETELMSYDRENNGEYLAFIGVNTKFLNENIDGCFALMEEIINNAEFLDIKRMKELLYELKSDLEDDFYLCGNDLARTRNMSYFSKRAAYTEYTSGIEFYIFLKDLLEKSKYELIRSNLYELKELLLNKDNFFINVTCSENMYGKVKRYVTDYLNRLNNKEGKIQPEFSLIESKNEFFLINSDVNYNAMASNFRRIDANYNGNMKVLSKIINSDYFWNIIRGKYGAYGAEFIISRNGNVTNTSYREPAFDSFATYENTYKYIESLKTLSVKELQKYIIGTINVTDRPLKNAEIAELSLVRYFASLTEEMIYKEREEILSTKLTDILNYEQLFFDLYNEKFICSIGGNDNCNRFDNIMEL